MSTGYHITVGYNSGGNSACDNAALEEVVRNICAAPEAILKECERVEGLAPPDEYADSYRQPWNDLTVKIVKNENDNVQVLQMASGGGVERGYKESMRRAFCRLVVEAMHRQMIEVNLHVT